MVTKIVNGNKPDNASCPECGHYNAMLENFGAPAKCRDCGAEAIVTDFSLGDRVVASDDAAIAGIITALWIRDVEIESPLGAFWKVPVEKLQSPPAETGN